MRDLSCLKTIISDNLAVHIDLTSIKSWDLNTGFTSVSLNKWSGAFSNDIFLYDFGLTGFDNGRVDEMTDSLNLYRSDNKVKLFRVGYNTPTGGTFYDGYGITGITATTTGATVGNYFVLDGGYLQGFFKLKDYTYQVMPYRYGKGVTFETLMYLTPESFNNGYFLFLGARAEDKYIPEFSGETVTFIKIEKETVNGSRGDYEIDVPVKEWSGVTTSEGNNLNSVSKKEVTKKAIIDEQHVEIIEVENIDNDIDGNVIGFYMSSDARLGYTVFNSKGLLISDESTSYTLPTGWTMIDFVFKPYEDITDPSLLDCTARRKGDFSALVNGRQVWKITDFDEFMFRGFKNSKEKQLGVPYNLSWGGGSFGLKHSYHWDTNFRTIFDGDSSVSIGTGFTFVNNPNAIYECPPEPVSGFTQYVTISGDNTTFSVVDPCDPFAISATTVLAVTQMSGATGTTAVTTTNEYYIEYAEELDLISNRDYTFKVNFFDKNIFRLYSTGETGLFFHGNVDILVIEEQPYIFNNTPSNEWFQIVYKIRLQDNTNKQKIKVGFYVKSDMALNEGFAFYFDNFNWYGSDKLVQDSRKQGQRIEQTYSQSFVGGIQKLRIYDAALTNQEILHNSIIEFKNKAYGVIVSKGGRLIYV